MKPVARNHPPPLQIALAGCGRWGTSLANAVSGLPEFALKWVCDPEVRRPETNWAPALTDEVCRDVDAVIVATPPEQHLAPTLVALGAGKPVLVEKPFAQSLAEVRQIKTKQHSVPVMVGHLLAYHAGYKALMDRVRDAETSLLVEVVRRSPERGATRCPWWTLAPHDLALLTRLFGEPDALRLVPMGDGVQAQLSWPRVHARLSYSTVASTKSRYWRVTSGSDELVLDEIEGVLRSRGEVAEVTSFADATPLQAELRHFAACVRGETEVLTGIAEAEQSVRLLCCGDQQLRAARRGHGFEQWTVEVAGGNL